MHETGQGPNCLEQIASWGVKITDGSSVREKRKLQKSPPVQVDWRQAKSQTGESECVSCQDWMSGCQ